MFPIFKASIKNAKVVFNDIQRFNDFLFTLNDKNIEIIVRLPRKDRSNPQNKFMWGVVYKLISEATGYTTDEVHDAMRMMFLKDEDRDIPTLKSTTSLTIVQMNEYWEKIQQFAAEKLNLQIPNPNEVEVV